MNKRVYFRKRCVKKKRKKIQSTTLLVTQRERLVLFGVFKDWNIKKRKAQYFLEINVLALFFQENH